VEGQSDEYGPWGFEVAGDLRLYAPGGCGAVIRLGVQTFGGYIEAGFAHRVTLATDGRLALQLNAAIGPTLGYAAMLPTDGFFYAEEVSGMLLGGFTSAEISVRTFKGMVIGLGASARVLGSNALSAPTVTITPMIRLGVDFGWRGRSPE
jgi:hypothetical protein